MSVDVLDPRTPIVLAGETLPQTFVDLMRHGDFSVDFIFDEVTRVYQVEKRLQQEASELATKTMMESTGVIPVIPDYVIDEVLSVPPDVDFWIKPERRRLFHALWKKVKQLASYVHHRGH